MLTGSDGQYDNKNVTVLATSLHKKSILISLNVNLNQNLNPTHEKAVISRPNPTQPMDGLNPSPTL